MSGWEDYADFENLPDDASLSNSYGLWEAFAKAMNEKFKVNGIDTVSQNTEIDVEAYRLAPTYDAWLALQKRFVGPTDGTYRNIFPLFNPETLFIRDVDFDGVSDSTSTTKWQLPSLLTYLGYDEFYRVDHLKGGLDFRTMIKQWYDMLNELYILPDSASESWYYMKKKEPPQFPNTYALWQDAYDAALNEFNAQPWVDTNENAELYDGPAHDNRLLKTNAGNYSYQIRRWSVDIKSSSFSNEVKSVSKVYASFTTLIESAQTEIEYENPDFGELADGNYHLFKEALTPELHTEVLSGSNRFFKTIEDDVGKIDSSTITAITAAELSSSGKDFMARGYRESNNLILNYYNVPGTFEFRKPSS